MSAMGDLVVWLNQQRTRLRQQVNMLERGETRTRSAGLVDTTADTLAQAKRNLAEVEALLARHRRSQAALSRALVDQLSDQQANPSP